MNLKIHPLKFLLVICFACPFLLEAQLVSHRFGGTNANDWGRSVQFDRNNGLLVTAGENDLFSPLEAVVFQKDPCFNPINSAWYGTAASNERFMAVRPYFNPMFGANPNGYVAVGTTDRFGTIDAYVVVLRPNLSVFASFVIPGPGGGNDIATAVEPTFDGGFVVVGITQTQLGDNDIFGVKFTAGLGTQWSLQYGGPGVGTTYDERALSVLQNPLNGNICIVGGTETYSISGNEDLYLMEVLSVNGNVIISGLGSHSWVIGSVFEENFNDVSIDPNTGVYHLTGRLNNGTNDDIIAVSFDPNGGGTLVYNRHDAGGTEFGTSTEYDQYTGLQVIVGYENSPGFTFGSMDAFSISMPPGGNAAAGLAWHYGDGLFEGFDEVDMMDTGGSMEFFTGGGTQSFGGPAPSNFYWIYSDVTGETGCAEAPYLPTQINVPHAEVQSTDYHDWVKPRKIQDMANYYNNVNNLLCTSSCKGQTIGDVVADPAEVSVKAYPNPAVSELSIATDAIEGLESVRLLDINGRILHSQEAHQQGLAQLDVSGFTAGVYFAEVRLSNGQVQRIKWIKN